jgi:hypothetical protein
MLTIDANRQAKKEPFEGVPRNGEDEGWREGQEEMIGLMLGTGAEYTLSYCMACCFRL